MGLMDNSFNKELKERKLGRVIVGTEQRIPKKGFGNNENEKLIVLYVGLAFGMVIGFIASPSVFLEMVREVRIWPLFISVLLLLTWLGMWDKFHTHYRQGGLIIFEEGLFNPDEMTFLDAFIFSTRRCWHSYKDIHSVFFRADIEDGELGWYMAVQIREEYDFWKDPSLIDDDYENLDVQALIDHFDRVKEKYGLEVEYHEGFHELMGLRAP